MSNLDVDLNEHHSSRDLLRALRTTRLIGIAAKQSGDTMSQKCNAQIREEFEALYLAAAEREGLTQAEVNRDLAEVETEISKLTLNQTYARN